MKTPSIKALTLFVALTGTASFLSPTKAEAAYTTFDCQVSKVQLTTTQGSQRVAAQCTASSGGGISWFAYRLSDNPELAKMFLSMLVSAKVAGRSLYIGYESTDQSGNAWGCEASNCRIMLEAQLF